MAATLEGYVSPLHVSTAPVGLGVPTVEVPTTHSDTPQSVGYERSARRRDLYPTTHNNHTRQKTMPSAGLEPVIPERQRPQTQHLDRTATGIGG